MEPVAQKRSALAEPMTAKQDNPSKGWLAGCSAGQSAIIDCFGCANLTATSRCSPSPIVSSIESTCCRARIKLEAIVVWAHQIGRLIGLSAIAFRTRE